MLSNVGESADPDAVTAQRKACNLLLALMLKPRILPSSAQVAQAARHTAALKKAADEENRAGHLLQSILRGYAATSRF